MEDKAQAFRNKLKEQSSYRVNRTYETVEESKARVAETKKLINELYPQIMEECKEALTNVEKKSKEKDER